MAHLLHGAALLRAIRETARTSERAWLVSGFVKSGFLERIGINPTHDLKVYSRWRISDLVSGGSDVRAAREVLTANGCFYIHPRLHAKVFLFDNTAFVGSANLTSSGLPAFDGTGNFEAALVASQTSEVIELIEELHSASLRLTTALIAEIEKEVEQLKLEQLPHYTELLAKMPDAFERSVRTIQDRPFTGADFPWCEEPSRVALGEVSDPLVQHDLELFSLSPNPSFAELKQSFVNSRCYAWLLSQTENEIRFGELSARLHQVLAGDPRPYRQEVKRLLSNLLTWAAESDPDGLLERQHRHTRSYRSARNSK